MRKNTNPTRLLAKKPKDTNNISDRETLKGHIRDVHSVADCLMRTIGQSCIESMGLDHFLVDDLRHAVLSAALIHDLGKANSHFQRAMQPGKHPPQALRHEWISTWLLIRFPELDQWLFGSRSLMVRYASLFAVLGHHLKIESGEVIACRTGGEDTELLVFTDHPDFDSCLQQVSGLLISNTAPTLTGVKIDLLSRPLSELRLWIPEARQWYGGADHETRRFISLTKAILIATDVAGSILPRLDHNVEEWTEAVLARTNDQDDIMNIASSRLGSNLPRVFQNKVAESACRVTFVKAGCGSGKTIAAYLWAARHAPGKKLFLCYPTTGTATEGYRDYIIPSEMSWDTALLHSRSEVDLEDIMTTSDEDPLERTTRIESLVAWDVPLIVSTADLVLGVIQNSRRSLFSFPSIANGAFVFDEIHQYDDRLFRALLRFLDVFRGVPVLLMTASLPRERINALKYVLNLCGEVLEVIEGPADLEQLPRYTIRSIQTDPPWEHIQKTLDNGGKVLWVANTVNRCMTFAQKAKELGFDPTPYHSRFRYCDRVKKHNEVIQSFKGSSKAFAITTQVCEVSLDISSDLLITDLAPVPALIQRMGRLNRRAMPGSFVEPKPVYILTPPFSSPYDDADLDFAKQWLSSLGASTILSQYDLAKAFEDLRQDENVSWLESAWMDGGPFSYQSPLREEGYTINTILYDDQDRCLVKGRPDIKELTRCMIPMPLGPMAKVINGWERLGYTFIAPQGQIQYSCEWGAKWAK